MKTTKKGFTLIELIVVIAIIGVLAAILVPSMLGYVKKSKVQSANSTASSVYKAINSALTEIDEQGLKVPVDGAHALSSSGISSTPTDIDELNTQIKNYFGDINKVEVGYAYIDKGSCIAVTVSTSANETYVGTYPALITTKNYGEKITWDATNEKVTTTGGTVETTGSGACLALIPIAAQAAGKDAADLVSGVQVGV